jgi:CheY-like chemotaxis protein
VAVKMLEKLGWRVDVSGTGREGLDLVHQLPYDVILVDCSMPIMNGYEFSRAVRALNIAAKSTPIICLSANAMPGHREECLDAGMNDFVSKPISLVELQRSLDRWTLGDEARRLAS